MTQSQSQVNVFKPQKAQLLTTNQFAILCRTTPRTIRFYDKNELLSPVYVDPFTKYRYYSPTQTRDFFKIRLLQDFKVPLKKMQPVLKSDTEETFLQTQLKQVKAEIEEKQKEYIFLKNIKKFLFNSKNPKDLLKEEVFGPYVLFCKTYNNGRYDRINKDIVELMNVAKKLKITITQKIMVFYLDPITYKPKDTRLEICLIAKFKIPTDIVLPNGYYFKEYPKTPVKVFTYKGPFEYITLIYQRLHELNGKKGVQILDPKEVGFDMHFFGPWNEKSPYDHLTKIAFLVE